MSIVVITGPHPDSESSDPSDLCRLWERAQSTGVDLVWRQCDTFDQLSQCLATPDDDAELIMLDVDAARIPPSQVDPMREALSALPMPYIEMHADSDAVDASTLAPGHPSVVSVVVPGNAMVSYDMALSIGLRLLRNRPATGIRLAA